MADPLTRILSLAGTNDCIQKVGSFPWPNDIVSLYYADDAPLHVSGDTKSLICLKSLLYEFEMMTSLKINFQKSLVYNLSRCEELGARDTAILDCNLGSFPFTYLWQPIKVTSLSKEDWQSLIERVEKRLSAWKGNAPSGGGRI